MNLNSRLRTVLGLFAVLITLLNLSTMAAAAPVWRQHCSVSGTQVDLHHEHSKVQAGCCDGMHCCPVPSRLPSPAMPYALRYQPHAHLKVEEPLLLVTSIDPPPRTIYS